MYISHYNCKVRKKTFFIILKSLKIIVIMVVQYNNLQFAYFSSQRILYHLLLSLNHIIKYDFII